MVQHCSTRGGKLSTLQGPKPIKLKQILDTRNRVIIIIDFDKKPGLYLALLCDSSGFEIQETLS